MKPLRLLHVCQGYAPGIGGTERVVQRLSEEFVRQFGDEVTVFTTNCYSAEAFHRPGLRRMSVGWEERNAVRIRRFPVRARVSRLLLWPQRVAYRLGLPGNQFLRAWFQGPLVPGLAAALRAQPADVVAAASFPLLHMFTALGASRASGRPCVFYGGLHPEDRWGFGRPMIFAAIRAAERYVAYSPFEARFVCEQGARAERVRRVPLGVDPEPFAAADRTAARRALGVAPEAPLVGFVGQLGFHKGADTLLAAMPAVWHQRPEARLLLAGARTSFSPRLDATIAAWPGAWRERLIERYDFDEDDKPALYAALDVFAYPSGHESFGLSFLEAWAAGRPVIGCGRGAVADVVREGRDGLLVPYRDPERLAAAILLLLGDPERVRELGEAGRRRVTAELTWPRVARGFREALVFA